MFTGFYRVLPCFTGFYRVFDYLHVNQSNSRGLLIETIWIAAPQPEKRRGPPKKQQKTNAVRGATRGAGGPGAASRRLVGRRRRRVGPARRHQQRNADGNLFNQTQNWQLIKIALVSIVYLLFDWLGSAPVLLSSSMFISFGTLFRNPTRFLRLEPEFYRVLPSFTEFFTSWSSFFEGEFPPTRPRFMALDRVERGLFLQGL